MRFRPGTLSPRVGSFPLDLTLKEVTPMARNKGNGVLAAILFGAGLLVLQDLLRDETESILKRNGLWPRG